MAFRITKKIVTSKEVEIALPFYGKHEREFGNKYLRINSEADTLNFAISGSDCSTSKAQKIVFGEFDDYEPCSKEEFDLAKEKMLSLLNN